MIESKKKVYKSKYYLRYRDKILKKYRETYVTKHPLKCKICGADLSGMENRHFRYCNECIKTKTSRQARWYRKNRQRYIIKKEK